MYIYRYIKTAHTHTHTHTHTPCDYSFFVYQIECEPESFVVTLCFAYCLLGRRMFFQHAQAGTGRRRY